MSEGVRRRNVASSGEGESKANQALEKVKRFDVFSKVDEDYLEKSQTGGTVTVVAAIFMALLFVVELQEFFTVQVHDSVLVDTSWKKVLPISLNLTFPRMRCDTVIVQVLDRSGERETDVRGKLIQVSLDRRGGVVQERVPKKGECLSCLDGVGEEHTCCNTCQALKNAYYAKGLSYANVAQTAEQCSMAVGCHIVGSITVPRKSLSGSIDAAIGHVNKHGGRNELYFNVQDPAQAIDTSHTIHSVAFGEPSMDGSPLDGTTKVADVGLVNYQYHLKLVPTILVDRWGGQVETNRYSFTDIAKSARAKTGKMVEVPGIFLTYEMMPFRMQSVEKSKPWSHILTSSCALIGGAFSVASLVETVLSKLVGRFFGCGPGVL
mmetsp:Transcript_47343/g.135768  ORF Transcript_47343/g.135768 Transcript_47343/m.135768 type:complete len:378 (-) Transcript_47343:70-1203(-)